MNKIVCDLCGASYPENATQCPICGIAKTDAAKSTTDSNTGYAYVKGGRFSHANVRKRNAGKKELPRVIAPVKPQKEAPAPKPKKETAPNPPKENQASAPRREQNSVTKRPAAPAKKRPAKESGKNSNVLLAIIALILVLAIVAVCAYIVKGFIDSRKQPNEPVGSSTTKPSVPVDNRVPCTDLKLALNQKTFKSLDDKFYLSVEVSPKDTCTDPVTFESSDDSIATVDAKGIVYPVANGSCVIYVRCGDFEVECYITCEVGVDPTNPTDPTGPTDPSGPVAELVLSKVDISLYGHGDSAIIYNGDIDPTQITWTSSDESVATVENGKVIAVGNGNATITAEYMGQTATCVVRCSNVVLTDYELRTQYGLATDFTIRVGDTVKLSMVEKESGKKVQPENLIFTLSKEGVITIDENGKITAIGTGTVTVTVSYGDYTLKCKVRVAAPKT